MGISGAVYGSSSSKSWPTLSGGVAEHKRPAGVVVCKLAGLELRQLFLDAAAVVRGEG
jgi:hypothetical protein